MVVNKKIYFRSRKYSDFLKKLNIYQDITINKNKKEYNINNLKRMINKLINTGDFEVKETRDYIKIFRKSNDILLKIK